MEFKYNTKQRIRTIQGLRSFKDALPTNVRKIIKKKGRIYSETLDNWRYIVGDDLFKVCYPKSFKSSNKLSSSILNIMVKRGHEVDTEYSKNLIIEKMNKFFGYDVVEKVKLIAARMLASDTSRINDDSGIGLTPGWDSLKQIEILLAVEHEFDIRFVSLDFSKLTTVGRISETVANLSQD